MVVATSDSNNTLVSLDRAAVKRVSSLEVLQQQVPEKVTFRQTCLYLPEDGFCLEDDDEETPLYLTDKTSEVQADACLGYLPQVLDARDELLALKPRVFSPSSPERLLYVCQGEVAHAVPSQCDVILSDQATTCHIIALRSTSNDNLQQPLVSLAHVDAPSHDKCIRAMIQQHKDHHAAAVSSPSCQLVQLSVHIIMGGFEDSNGSSKKISNWLIHLLADVAQEEKHWLHMTLRDCAVSSLNESGHASPIGRGLAMDVRSGRVFLAQCEALGPRTTLRAARLWSSNDSPTPLSLIHDQHANTISVQPFLYRPFPGLDTLLTLTDEMLLQYTSTSPECEQEGFCSALRTTLTLVRDVPCRRVFGPGCNRALVYTRVGNSNTWRKTMG